MLIIPKLFGQYTAFIVIKVLEGNTGASGNAEQGTLGNVTRNSGGFGEKFI